MRKRKAGRPGNAIEGLDSFTLFRRPYVPTVTGRARELEFERDCSDVQRLDLAELIRGVVSVVRRVLVVGEVETDVVLARGRLDEGVLGVEGYWESRAPVEFTWGRFGGRCRLPGSRGGHVTAFL